MKIRKGDMVKIISGNDQGKHGKVLAVFPREEKLAVEGVNIKKKHVRPRQQGKKGEVVHVPLPFPIARAMIICGKCSQPTRAGWKISADDTKRRVCKKCGGEI